MKFILENWGIITWFVSGVCVIFSSIGAILLKIFLKYHNEAMEKIKSIDDKMDRKFEKFENITNELAKSSAVQLETNKNLEKAIRDINENFKSLFFSFVNKST